MSQWFLRKGWIKIWINTRSRFIECICDCDTYLPLHLLLLHRFALYSVSELTVDVNLFYLTCYFSPGLIYRYAECCFYLDTSSTFPSCLRSASGSSHRPLFFIKKKLYTLEWVIDHIRSTILSVAISRSMKNVFSGQNNSKFPFFAVKTWIKMTHMHKITTAFPLLCLHPMQKISETSKSLKLGKKIKKSEKSVLWTEIQIF